MSVVSARPPSRKALITQLRACEEELRNLGVAGLWLFGSVVRDEAEPGSDVDLFFDYDDPHLNLFHVMEIEERVAAITGMRADLMTRESLHPRLRGEIVDTAVRVF